MRRTLTTLVVTIMLLRGGVITQGKRPQDVELQAAIRTQTVDGNLNSAIKQFQAIVDRFKTDRAVVAVALVQMAECYEKLDDPQAQKIYERLLLEFGDQREAAANARARLAVLQPPAAAKMKQAAREIWVGPGNELQGATPSQDGRYMSFTDVATGNLAIRDVTTGTSRRLTNTGGWSSGEYTAAAVISPDGRQVAYIHYVDRDNKVDLRVASIATAESASPRVVLRTEQNDGFYRIAWMPDGQQLLVIRVRPDRTSQIGIVTIQDGSFRSIKSLEWRQPNLLSVSPDGRYVAYDVPAGEARSPRDIVVLATDGSQETVAVQNPANDSFPLWSPDGSHLVFLSDRSGSSSVWTVPIGNGRPSGPAALVKSDVGGIRLIGMSKTGTLFYVEPPATRRNLYVADLDSVSAMKAPVPGTERLISNNLSPTWSGDGEYLAYYSLRETSPDTSSGVLVIRTMKTGEERTVPLPTRLVSRFGAGPKWFPDHRSVLVESGDAQGSGFGFYRLALDTGNIDLVAHLPSGVTAYDLSRDGRKIYYAITTEDGRKLMRVDLESHQEIELRKAALSEPEILSIAVSPDGMQLATTLTGGFVEVRPVAGGQSRQVFRPAPPSATGTAFFRQSLAWTPDQYFVLFVREGGALWKVPALGGDAETVGISMGVWGSPALHPDGKRIVFSAPGGPNTSKVLALENLILPVLKPSR